MFNVTIRAMAKKAGVPLWRVAKELHYSESTMTRKLRCELPDDERELILGIILRLKKVSWLKARLLCPGPNNERIT